MDDELLPMSELDQLRISCSALLVEVAELRKIRDAAEYVTGPEECREGACEEYFDDSDSGVRLPGVVHCSHLTVGYATVNDVLHRQRLEWLVNGIRKQVDAESEGIGAEVREELHSAVYSMAADYETGIEVDETREPYRAVLGESQAMDVLDAIERGRPLPYGS